MKRKALIILTVAILAFAMIPAIGAGAATGVVKIVTPDQLANPSGKTGSDFEKLTETNFVSDKTGTVDSLQDAGGTLYVVIDDNDDDSNSLTDYYAYFTADAGAEQRGGNRFVIDPNPDEASSAAGAVQAGYVTGTDGKIIADVTDGTSALPTGAADLQVGDRNRTGEIDGADIVIELGFIPTTDAIPADDDQTDDVDESAVPLKFVSDQTLRTQNAFLNLSTDGKTLFLDVNDIPTLNSLGDPPANMRPALRITFSSAGPNVLEYEEGKDKGKSRVQVTSTSGDPILVSVSEKDLGAFDGDGVTASDLKGNSSRDSGVFVGIFGVIRNEFKDAALEWAPIATETNFADGDDDEDNDAADFTVGAGDLNAVTAENLDTTDDDIDNPDAFETTLTISGFGENDVLKEGSVKVAVSTNRDTSDEPDVADSPAELVVALRLVGDPDESGDIVVTVTTTASAAALVNNANADGATEAGDVFSVSYTIGHPNDNISHLLDSVTATDIDTSSSDQSAPFEGFCDSGELDTDKQCAQRDAFLLALESHQINLGLADNDDADTLLGMIIGVDHGDTLSVRYSDQSPRSVRTDSAEVDLNGPIIGGFTLANGAYIDEDDFEVLFDVTDADSGIFEDSHDPAEATIRSGVAYVAQEVLVGVGGPATEELNLLEGSGADLDVDDEIDDGERYELTIDVTHEAESAEGTDDTPAVTVRVKVTITAYDAARNKSMKTVNYVVDTIDPVMEEAITGWGVKSRSSDAYVLVENQRDRIALVFDDTVQGDLVQAQDVSVPGSVVLRVTWLSNTGNNKIDVGEAGAGDGDAKDLDFNAKTDTSSSANDVVKALGLEENTDNQDARHILFLTLDADLPTDATPTVEIDNNDLIDLAGNENRADHRAVSEDRLAPSFEVTVDQKLSNSDLSVTIIASEALDRRPRASITLGDDSITVSPSDNGNNNYTIDTDRAGLGIGSNGSQNGVWTLSVTGTDENDNVGTSSAKWELDTTANEGDDPSRRGGPDAAGSAHEIEVNEIIFLTVEFSGEGDEYGTTDADDEYTSTDSSKTIDVTGLTLETLAAGDISAKNVAKARSARTIEATADVGAASAQSNDNVKHVVALADLEQGNYNLKVDYVDAAGNTGSFDYIFQVIAPRPAVIDITPGWTLISIPGRPQNPAIEAVFENSAVTEVWSLNNATKAWEFARKSPVDGTWGESTLDQIIDGRGYFVRSATFDPVKVLVQRFSPQREPAMYNITAGWNSVGYTPAGSEKSIEVDGYLGALGISGWGIIRTWNTEATPPQYESYYSSGAATTGFPTDGDDGPAIVQAGKGYLLFATRAGTIGG